MTNDEIKKARDERAAEVAALDAQIIDLRVQRAGAFGALTELLKMLPAADSGAAVTLSEQVARFVESEPGVVTASDIAAHLRDAGAAFNPNSLSTLLGRLAENGRLRKLARGEFCSADH